MLNPYLKFFYKSHKVEAFGKFNAEYFSKLLVSKEPAFWQKAGEKMALALFHSASRRVPAYRDILKKNKINPEKIKSISDFKFVPIIDKENYLKKYPIEKFCWDGRLNQNTLFSVSSGSSGVPFFWPRGNNLELETSISHELFLRDIFQADRHSTLFIVTFSMGIYIAGIITLNSILRVAQKSYPIMVIAPGINVDETLRIVGEVGGKFEQVVIAGYPPFVKDIIEAGERDGLNWRSLKIKFLFATEGFSEAWRDYILDKVGSKDALRSSLNIYGSADAGILGHETPACIFLRRTSPELFKENNILPTLTQYNPILKFFETAGDEVIFSCYGGIPLVRYNICDAGGIKSFEEVAETADFGSLRDVWKLPFLYVFSKSDNTCSLYGVNIYPENIKTALEDKSLRDRLTGKFVMQAKNRKNQDQYLEINIELQDSVAVADSLADEIGRIIVKNLEAHNLEYNRLRQSIKRKANPEIILWPKNHPTYFNPQSIKQRWKINR